MVRTLLIALAIAACQGGGSEPPAPAPIKHTPSDAAKPVAIVVEDARPKAEEPEPAPDPGKLIADLNAISAWQAVVDRGQLLARRAQHGIVYGRVGAAIMVPAPAPPATGSGDAGVKVDAGTIASPYVWLVDDTEGNGTLGIRVKLEGRAKEGERVALGGAWDLDEQRTWYWKVDKVQVLPPAPASDLKEPPAPEPTHVIANGELAPGARTISLSHDGDAVYFQVVGPPPPNDGDGWPVADELGNPPFALLNLPGERASYGGQDLRAPDERWQLKRGQTYWVRIGKIRKRAIDKPALINARTAPVRVQ